MVAIAPAELTVAPVGLPLAKTPSVPAPRFAVAKAEAVPATLGSVAAIWPVACVNCGVFETLLEVMVAPAAWVMDWLAMVPSYFTYPFVAAAAEACAKVVTLNCPSAVPSRHTAIASTHEIVTSLFIKLGERQAEQTSLVSRSNPLSQRKDFSCYQKCTDEMRGNSDCAPTGGIVV